VLSFFVVYDKFVGFYIVHGDNKAHSFLYKAFCFLKGMMRDYFIHRQGYYIRLYIGGEERCVGVNSNTVGFLMMIMMILVWEDREGGILWLNPTNVAVVAYW
jgi:hypothetical protein